MASHRAPNPSACKRSAIGSARHTSRRSSTAGWPSSPPRSTGTDRAAGLLVGALDAPGRNLAHPGVRRATPSPRLLRGTRRRQPRPRTPRRSAADFGRQIRSNTESTFSTKVVTRGVDVIVNVFYKHSRIKEYLKEGRALRIETVCNSPTDLGCKRRLRHPPELQAKARAANRRLLTIQRAGQGCAVSTALFERIALPSLEEGQRTGALRFGDPRTMALVGALCIAINAVAGFTNRSLRAQVAGLLGTPYTRVADDLRPASPSTQRPDPAARPSNTYVLTADGIVSRSSTPRSTAALLGHCSPPTIPCSPRTPPGSPGHRPQHRPLHHQRPPREPPPRNLT